MAQSNISQALRDEFLDLTQWSQNMVAHLKNNFSTQNVFPHGNPGPYIGYRNTPDAKRSTGDGINSIYAAVWSGSGGDTKKISFFFNYYLYFVDMGVGSGDPYRYQDDDYKWGELFEEWKEKGDRQSRPIIGPELRHQLDRLGVIVSSYYGDFVENGMVSSFGGGLKEGEKPGKTLR